MPISDLYLKAEQALLRYWGYSEFRPGQDRAVQSILAGKDTLVLFPTGGGKSLCFQVPALVLDGLTLVISPLIALMTDQVEQLTQRGIPATYLNGSLSQREIEQRLVNARNGMYKLLYVAPERLTSGAFQTELDALNVTMVAVDEAHCISEWGHDFRPSYRQIRTALEGLAGTVRWMALTATATPEVREDIVESLGLREVSIVALGFARKNLTWWVVGSANKQQELMKTVQHANTLGSGIVYAPTRRECESWAARFSQKGIAAKAYHAGLTPDIRNQVQQEWINGVIPLVVATNAFGMGIDKPDCRYVVHYKIPSTLEAYYQEAGRAGRDQERAYPILLYSPKDIVESREAIERSYPAYDQLKTVYRLLCDELGLAVGERMSELEELSLDGLSQRGDLRLYQVETALRILHRLGVIDLDYREEMQVRVCHAVDRETFEETLSGMQVEKSEFLDRLVRVIGGHFFEDGQWLEAEELASRMELRLHSLQKALSVLEKQDRLLKTEWKEKQLWIRLRESRQETFPVQESEAEAYRSLLLKKLDYVEQYTESQGCREVYLRSYFGETGGDPCGVCDRCKAGNPSSKDVSSQWEEAIHQDPSEVVLMVLEQAGSLTANELKTKTALSSSVLRNILARLIREERIVADSKTTSYRLYPSGK